MAGGALPARWFERGLPPPESRDARTGRLSIEIVSHCWNYAHLLVYQLSSLALNPPRDADVTMTVYHASEDARTTALLGYFGGRAVPNVAWNWQVLPKAKLFRRAIGRNLAALGTRADWVWFTDCDLLFGAGCLDALAREVQGRRDALVHPQEEWVSALLDDDDPLLVAGRGEPQVLGIDPTAFTRRTLGRATGPVQIAHGDVARAVGYCRAIAHYQQPSECWAKAHEDRAFRWLVQNQGVGLNIPSVFRIRHASKGRYTGRHWVNEIRRWNRSRQTYGDRK